MLTITLALAGLIITAGAPDAQADALSAEGKGLFAQRRYAEAIATFHASNELRPSTANVYNIGKCYERLGETGLALRYYREYLRLEPAAERDAAVHADVDAAEARLKEAGRQQLAVLVEPASARVTIDGAWVKGFPAYAELASGEHELEVSAEGYVTQQLTFPMGLDRIAEVRVALQAGAAGTTRAATLAPMPGGGRAVRLRPSSEVALTEASNRAKRTASLVLGGTALALLAGGVTAGVLALNDHERAVKLQAEPNREAFDAATAAATREMVLANVAYGLSAAAFAAGLYLAISGGLFDALGSPRAAVAPLPGGAALVFSLGL